ncbi:hypothetical protein [Nostoc sp. T09]|uniref:hypothetical protein n=1 Tax=Nostoc sp. T09 TaxID=1932621 RepID=UPI0015C4EE06|nr:hypothetical protein [Nostoc sp. T09]
MYTVTINNDRNYGIVTENNRSFYCVPVGNGEWSKEEIFGEDINHIINQALQTWLKRIN